MPEQVRDRRTARWCWQDRAALERIRDGLAPTRDAATGLAIYVALTARANAAEQCWPKVETLAADAGVSGPTARRRIRDLEQLGLIEVIACIGQDGDTSNTYALLDPPPGPPPPNWRQIPPPMRTMIKLEPEARSTPHALSAAHRKTLQNTRSNGHNNTHSVPVSAPEHYHHDSAGSITTSVPPLHSDSPSSITMTPQLTSLKTQNEDPENNGTSSKINDEISPTFFDRPAPAQRIGGMPAPSVWAAIVDELASSITKPNLDSLRGCYLAGDLDHLIVVVPSIHVARMLHRRVHRDLEAAAARVMGAKRITFDGVEP